MKRVTDLLGFAIEGQDVLRAARAQRVLRDWEDIVGEFLASKVKVDRYDHGTLFVEAEGSAWAQEFRLNSETILSRLDERADEPGLFKKIRVGIRRSE